jgi:hypothetical protein
MSYDVSKISSGQKVAIKSLAELVDVLSDINLDDATGQSDTIVLDDGTEVNLGFGVENDRAKTTITLRKNGLKYTLIEEKDV